MALPREATGLAGEAEHKLDRAGHAPDDLDVLHGKIVTYLGKLSQKNLVEPQPKQLYEYIGVANYLKSFGDVIENNLLDDADK